MQYCNEMREMTAVIMIISNILKWYTYINGIIDIQITKPMELVASICFHCCMIYLK